MQYRKELCREQRTNSRLGRGSSLNESRYESQLAAKNQKIDMVKDQNSYLDSELKSHRKEITKLRKGSASKASRESASESMMGSYIHYERPSSATKPKKIHSCTHAQSLVMSPTMLPKSSISPVRRAPFKSNEGKGYKSAL